MHISCIRLCRFYYAVHPRHPVGVNIYTRLGTRYPISVMLSVLFLGARAFLWKPRGSTRISPLQLTRAIEVIFEMNVAALQLKHFVTRALTVSRFTCNPAAFHMGDEEHNEFSIEALTAQGWMVSEVFVYIIPCGYSTTSSTRRTSAIVLRAWGTLYCARRRMHSRLHTAYCPSVVSCVIRDAKCFTRR